MSVSKYLRIGLRADKNLADLPNKTTSLGNILDDLIPNQSFIPGDLQVINGLNTTNIWAEDLAELVDLSVQYSPLYIDGDGNLNFAAPVDVQPRIRAVDKIKNEKVILGDPPYRLGGKGPIAKVFPSTALISPGSALLSHSTGAFDPDNVFDPNHSGVITTQEYWMDGRFGFNSAFHPSFGNSFGGISWTGWLSNADSRRPDFFCNSFFFIQKYDAAISQWITVKARTEENWAATVQVNNTGDTTKVQFNEVDRKFLFQDVQLGAVAGSPTHTIVDIDHSSSGEAVCTLQSISGAANLSVSAGDTLHFSSPIGEMIGDNNFRHTDEMAVGDTQQVRITVWYPKPQDFNPSKTVSNYPSFGMRYDLGVDIDTVSDTVIDGDQEYTPFNYLYAEQAGAVNAPVVPNTFAHFQRNVISERNKNLSHYFQNVQPLYIRYTPKLKVNEVSRFSKGTGNYEITSTNLVWRGNTRFTGSSTVMREIKVGDILLFAEKTAPVDSGATIGSGPKHFFLQVSSNNNIDTLFVEPYKFSSQGVTESVSNIMQSYAYSVNESIRMYVIDSKGLIGVYTQVNVDVATLSAASRQYALRKVANSDYQDPSLSSTDYFDTDVRPGDLFANLSILNNSTGNANLQQPMWFEKITSVDASPTSGLVIDAESFDTGSHTPTMERTRSANSYGLIYAHRGLNDQSTATECVGVVGAEVASQVNNSTSVPLTYVPDGLQTTMKVYFAGLDINNPIIPDGTTVTNISGNTVTLSTAVSLNQSVTVVFAPSTSTSNKEGCIMPLNTAPPFSGTNDGLETTGTAPHLVVGGEFAISGIKFEDATSVEVTPSTDDADGGLLVQDSDGNKYWALTD